jgi:hypothetical protein
MYLCCLAMGYDRKILNGEHSWYYLTSVVLSIAEQYVGIFMLENPPTARTAVQIPSSIQRLEIISSSHKPLYPWSAGFPGVTRPSLARFFFRPGASCARRGSIGNAPESSASFNLDLPPVQRSLSPVQNRGPEKQPLRSVLGFKESPVWVDIG